MDIPRNPSILAVDGGGTRCRIASVDENDMHCVETGSANVSTDFAGGIAQILSGLETLADRIGTTVQALGQRPGFIGLAGVTGPDMAARVKDALPLHQIRVADDRPAALRGALAETDGALAHCGTGSFFGIQQGRTQRFVGGWGPVLGDEASAQWIGRMALNATLRSVDQIGDTSPLTDSLLTTYHGAAGIVQFATTATPRDFGALAPLVTTADAKGDLVAHQVMQLGAKIITDTLHDLGWNPDQNLCLTGGIAPFYAPHLPSEMRRALVDPIGSPMDGAIALAQDFAQGFVTGART